MHIMSVSSNVIVQMINICTCGKSFISFPQKPGSIIDRYIAEITTDQSHLYLNNVIQSRLCRQMSLHLLIVIRGMGVMYVGPTDKLEMIQLRHTPFRCCLLVVTDHLVVKHATYGLHGELRVVGYDNTIGYIVHYHTHNFSEGAAKPYKLCTCMYCAVQFQSCVCYIVYITFHFSSLAIFMSLTY